MRASEAARNTAALIEGTVDKVKEGSDLVTKTAEAFSQVAGSTGKIRELVAEIAAASGEQAQGVDQINKARDGNEPRHPTDCSQRRGERQRRGRARRPVPRDEGGGRRTGGPDRRGS